MVALWTRTIRTYTMINLRLLRARRIIKRSIRIRRQIREYKDDNECAMLLITHRIIIGKDLRIHSVSGEIARVLIRATHSGKLCTECSKRANFVKRARCADGGHKQVKKAKQKALVVWERTRMDGAATATRTEQSSAGAVNSAAKRENLPLGANPSVSIGRRHHPSHTRAHSAVYTHSSSLVVRCVVHAPVFILGKLRPQRLCASPTSKASASDVSFPLYAHIRALYKQITFTS